MSLSTHNSDYQLLLSILRTTRKRVGYLRSNWQNGWATHKRSYRSASGERRLDAVELVEFAEALGVPALELLGEYLDKRSSSTLAYSRKTKSRI